MKDSSKTLKFLREKVNTRGKKAHELEAQLVKAINEKEDRNKKMTAIGQNYKK